MFNVVFIKQLLLFIVFLLNQGVLIFKYRFVCYKNLIIYNTKKFYNLQIKRLKNYFKSILKKKLSIKKFVQLFYSLLYFTIGLFILVWPLKDTGLGSIILSRYIIYNVVFTFDAKAFFECDMSNVYMIIHFFLYKYLICVTYFSIVTLFFILIAVIYSKLILKLYFNTIKVSFYFFITCCFILYASVTIKFLLSLLYYLSINIIYHLILCIEVIQSYYIASIDTFLELLFLLLWGMEIYYIAFKYFITDQLDILVNWISNSYCYLIINLLIELIIKKIPNLIINLINNISFFIKQIISMSNPLYVVILNLIVIILFILIGGIIPLVERKYLSLIQRRVGPKFVGYNGRLQFIADALKLLFKEIIFLINTNKVSFVIIPIFLLNLNIFLLINLVWVNNIFYIENEYFILLILLIELITSIYTAYIGFVVKNKYTIIASTRLLNGVIVFEIFLITIYFYLYIINSKLSLDNVYYNQIFNLKFKVNLIILPPIVYAVLLNLKKVPFDIIEAETELIMGYTTEHSGFLGGALLLIEYLHLFFWSLLILTLFLI